MIYILPQNRIIDSKNVKLKEEVRYNKKDDDNNQLSNNNYKDSIKLTKLTEPNYIINNDNTSNNNN